MVVNHDNSSRAHAIIVTCIILPIISALFVALRVWTRVFVSHCFGKDDCVAVVALLCCIVFSVLQGMATNYDIGWHQKDMTPEISSGYYKWIYGSSIFYIFSLCGYKMAILLLYLRLFNVNRMFKHFTWAVMFFVFGYLFCNFWTQLFGCTPPSKFWSPHIPGHCIDFKKADIIYAAMNASSDLFIVLLPLPMIWRLKLSRKEKIGLTIVLATGAIACAVAATRIVYAIHDLYAVDRSWLAGDTFMWSVLEINTGLICSCTPTFKPFLKHWVSGFSFRSHSFGYLSRLWSVVSFKRSKSNNRSKRESLTELANYRGDIIIDNSNTREPPVFLRDPSSDGLENDGQKSSASESPVQQC